MAAQQLCGVTGHCTTLRGPVEASIRVGPVEQELPVYVPDIDDPCLLGLDYLLESHVCLDFGKMRMEVQGKEVLLMKVNANTQVVAAKTTCVPPRIEIWVSCRLSRDMENEVCLVESSPLSQCRMDCWLERHWKT